MNQFSLLDGIVVALAMAHLVRCLKHGSAFAIRSFLGFIGGGSIALLGAPWALTKFMDPDTPTSLITILSAGLVALGAWLGMLLAADSSIEPVYDDNGNELPPRKHSSAGLIIGAITVVAMTGSVAHLAWQSGEVTAARYVSKSPLLAAASSVIPDRTVQWAVAVLPGRVQTATGLPVLPLHPEPGDSRYTTPELADVKDGARIAKKSLVKISGVAEECQEGYEGSGFVIKPGYVMTNAHVIAGVDEPLVQLQGVGRHYVSTVVAYDEETDLAVLRVNKLKAAPLRQAVEVNTADTVAALGFPLGGPYRVSPGVLIRTATINNSTAEWGTTDSSARKILVVGANVQSGNSGGPLINANGELAGVIFAKSTNTDNTGYAITLADVRSIMRGIDPESPAVTPGSCVDRP